jgi:hypothetical protein
MALLHKTGDCAVFQAEFDELFFGVTIVRRGVMFQVFGNPEILSVLLHQLFDSPVFSVDSHGEQTFPEIFDCLFDNF